MNFCIAIKPWSPQHSIWKPLLIMKLVISLLISAILQAHATGYAQQITLDKKDASLIEIFKDIRKQNGFDFFYNSAVIKKARPVSITVTDASLEEVLEQCFRGQPLVYAVELNTVIVREKPAKGKSGAGPAATTAGTPTLPAQIEVKGVVKDEQGGPLPGATIRVKSTGQIVLSDLNGEFSLPGVDEDAVLVISYTGFVSQEVALGGRTELTITLKMDMAELSQVVIVGYGSVEKGDLTGSVASIGEDALTEFPVTNTVQAMQGKAAGVVVQSVNGEPGGDFKIRVRGTSSINANGDPLFVVDGIVGGIVPSPEDIASIEVLKDASASAIYGSRGANGVVMITTKSGKVGKPKVSFNSFYSVNREIGRLDLLNARDFAEYINEARSSDFYDLDNLEANTDWQDLIFRPGYTQNYQLSVSGGTDKVKYYVSGVYFDQKGVIHKSRFNRLSLTTNLDFEVSEHVEISMNSSLRTSKRDGILSQTGGGGENAGPITAAYRFDPNLGITDENGVYNKSKVGIAAFENPVATLRGRDEENTGDDFQTNIRAKFTLAEGLVFNSTYGMIVRNQRNAFYNNRISNRGERINGEGEVVNRKNLNYLTEQYLTYNLSVNEKHNIELTGGTSYQNLRTEAFTAANSGFISDALGFWNLGVGTNLVAPGSSYTESKMLSFYGRMNYDFDKRYLLTVTGRYDGASQFSKENKWSFFPSGAFSWNVSNEDFYPSSDVLSALKLRTSYGLTGNQAINPYQSLARISSTFFVLNNSSTSSVRPTSIANKNLTWETTAQFNVGMDLEFFRGRINLTSDYYHKKTNDLLFNIPIPSFSGYQSMLGNLGEIENKGFELSVTSRNLTGALKWSSTLNLTLNRNKVLSLPGGTDIIYARAPSFTGAVQNSILREGAPIGSFYGFVYEGVYQEGDDFIPGGAFETVPGGEKYKDLDGNGVLDNDDRQIIGDPNPDAVWGLNNDLSFKGFSLNIFLQAYTGADMLNLVRMELDRLSGNSNATTDALNRWTPENTDTDIPRATSSRVSRTSTRFVENGSYIRLKNISLSYDFPAGLLQNLKIGSAQVYVSGQNLLTFTDYSGVDPEVSFRSSNTDLGLDFGSYPNVTAFTVGINIGF